MAAAEGALTLPGMLQQAERALVQRLQRQREVGPGTRGGLLRSAPRARGALTQHQPAQVNNRLQDNQEQAALVVDLSDAGARRRWTWGR